MAELSDYRFREGEKYWQIPHYLPEWAANGKTISAKYWTITVHEQSCRYAKGARRTIGTEHVGYLAERGFDPPKRHQSVTWTGCKVCRTATRHPNEWWMALAKAELATRRAADIARHEAGRAAQRVFEAKKAREIFIKDAQEEYYNRVFKAQVEEVFARIAVQEGDRWDAENPEQAALLEPVKETA